MTTEHDDLRQRGEVELARRLKADPLAPETYLFAARMGRDLAREHVNANRSGFEALLTVRCGGKGFDLLATVWPTPWGRWVECLGYEPTPAGWRDIASQNSDLRGTADRITGRGRYPDQSGLLSATKSDPAIVTLQGVVRDLRALERAAYESHRAPGYSPPAQLRHSGCRCAAWSFTDVELLTAIAARKRRVVLTDSHRVR
jgi:hypothetical protein